MNHEQAVAHLRAMLRALQKRRSLAAELDYPVEVLEHLNPWIYGDKCPIPALAKLIDRAENGGRIRPLDFFNMVAIATTLEPSIGFLCRTNGDPDFPERPDPHWLKSGWWNDDQPEAETTQAV